MTPDEYAKMIAGNPELQATDQMNEDLSAAASAGSDTGHVGHNPSNKMAENFESIWYSLGGQDLEEELRFHTTRRWRLDYCHLATRTAIELEGGVWTQGRHTRGAGFVNDCEKYNAAHDCGYVVFRLATGMVTPEHIERIIAYINRKNGRAEQWKTPPNF